MAITTDDLFPGSFRGINFLIESSTVSGGRKVAIHEFPNSDNRYVEDLGLLNEKITINATISTSEYFSGRDSLKAALEDRGYGQLIHPFYGLKTVAVESYSIDESTSELGYIKLNLTFVVGQELNFPGNAGILDSNMLLGIFDIVMRGLSDLFVTRAITKRDRLITSNFIQLNADVYKKYSETAEFYISRSQFNSIEKSELKASLDKFNENLTEYVFNPRNLINNVVELNENFYKITNTGQELFNISSNLFKYSNSEPYRLTSIGLTNSQKSREANKKLIEATVKTSAFCLLPLAVSEYEIKLLDDVLLLESELKRQWEFILESDFVEEDIFQQLADYYSITSKYLENKKLLAPQLISRDVTELPLSIFEYENYGELNRTDDLRLLNRIEHPNPVSLNGSAKYYSK